MHKLFVLSFFTRRESNKDAPISNFVETLYQLSRSVKKDLAENAPFA